jgi:hypothetical protein
MGAIRAEGDISNVIDGISPDWGPFGQVGDRGRTLVQALMAAVILMCFALAAWGAFKQRFGASATRDVMAAEHGKGLIVAGLTGAFIVGSLGTLFTIIYGLAI